MKNWFVPRDAPKCRKCGLHIGFRKIENGRWTPCNLDGGDHWDLCRQTRLANASPEEKAARARHDAKLAAPVVIVGRECSHVYRCLKDSLPPWDGRLGPVFRPFTSEEIAEGAVCRPI